MKEDELDVNSAKKDTELGIETRRMVNEFPKLFKRSGKMKNYQIKMDIKNEARITQQKRRQIPSQVQKAVGSEVERLLRDGHIKRVVDFKGDALIQPTVITVKKDRSLKIAFDARALNRTIDKDKISNVKYRKLDRYISRKIIFRKE